MAQNPDIAEPSLTLDWKFAVLLGVLQLSLAIIGNWQLVTLVVFWMADSALGIAILQADQLGKLLAPFSKFGALFKEERSNLIKLAMLFMGFAILLAALIIGGMTLAMVAGAALLMFVASTSLLTFSIALVSTALSYALIVRARGLAFDSYKTRRSVFTNTILGAVALAVAATVIFSQPGMNSIKTPWSENVSGILIFFCAKTASEAYAFSKWKRRPDPSG